MNKRLQIVGVLLSVVLLSYFFVGKETSALSFPSFFSKDQKVEKDAKDYKGQKNKSAANSSSKDGISANGINANEVNGGISSKDLSDPSSGGAIVVDPGFSSSKSYSESNKQLRDQLLGNILKNRLESMHFTEKEIDDDVSDKAFTLYVEKIDPGKQFLLQEDVEYLSKYKKLIDDEIVSGEFDLVRESSKLLRKRLDEVAEIVETLAKGTFDFNKKEMLEYDAKKRNFVKNKENKDGKR